MFSDRVFATPDEEMVFDQYKLMFNKLNDRDAAMESVSNNGRRLQYVGDRFKNETAKIDKRRGEIFTDVFPELANLMNPALENLKR